MVECPEKISPGGQHFDRCDFDNIFVENNTRPAKTNLIMITVWLKNIITRLSNVNNPYHGYNDVKIELLVYSM